MKIIKIILILYPLLILGTLNQPVAVLIERPSDVTETDTVFVAPPTGERQTDRASILAALKQVEPGGTLQFAPGTYLMGGEIIRITVPRVTLTGHPEGTTLRGCHPDEFPMENSTEFGNNCNGLELVGGWQTVRNLTFEHIFWALHVGCCWDSQPHMMPGEGGHLIEGNTFRSNSNALRVHGYWSAPTVIRNNQLLNNWHSISVYGNTAHILNNKISVPEPEKVPGTGFPADGIHIAIPMSLHESAEGIMPSCENNIISGNLIDGVTEGIMMSGGDSEITCRNNVIRDNTVIIRRAHPPAIPAFIHVQDQADSTVVGVPLALRGSFDENLIEGNIIQGAEGLGIEIRGSSRNRIINNKISNVELRKPFPGNAMAALPILGGNPETWRNANGSGIWVSPGSNGNKIMGNTFEDIYSYAVFMEGDSNRVEMGDLEDGVRDLGNSNQVNTDTLSVAPDTTRFTIIINGHRQGERRMWQEAPDTWRYEHNGDAFHFPRTERLVVDADGFPLMMEIDGQRIVWDRWIERYERRDGHARWTAHTQSMLGPSWARSLGDGEAEVSGHFYYAALHPVHDPGVLARLLLQREDSTLPLLPDGTARIESVGERWVEVNDSRRRIHLYAVHGLDLKPAYVWLDEDGATFADEWSVLAGWEDAFPELRAASEEALADYHRVLARTLVPPVRERPLVISGTRLFDPQTGTIKPGTTIVIEGTRITAVGPDGVLDLPPGVEVMDAAGRTVLPGLWDMHTHHGFPGPHFELMAPLYLAGGITTARDMGMPMEPMLSLRQRIQAGQAVGPRPLLAGWVGGAGGRPTGALVANETEARAVLDRYLELGYDQIKIYNDLPPDLVPLVIKHAKEHNLRLSGEVVNGMTAREAIGLGYEEIQHLDALLFGLIPNAMTELLANRTPDRLEALNEALVRLTADSRSMQELIQLLVLKGVAVDPTLVVFASQGMEPPPWVKRIANRFPSQAERRILDRHLFGYWALSPLWDEILRNMVTLVGALHEAGVPILPGTDTEMGGFDLHQELALYVEAGIPAPEVLTLATLGAARIMGMDDEFGSIEPGKLADLILIDGDPTTDISDIRRVMTVIKNGRVYDPAAIYRALGIEPCCEE